MTSAPGLALILSAKSLSDEPRRTRMTVVPSPRGTLTPPSDGACICSNSWRLARLDLRPRTGRPPPRPKAPCGRAATAGATAETAAATGTTGEAAAGATAGPPGHDRRHRGHRATGATTGGTLTGTADRAAVGHHARARTRTTGTRTAGPAVRRDAAGSAGTGRRDGSAAAACPGWGRTGCCRGAPALSRERAHALAGRERVVARTRAHARRARGLPPGRGAPGAGRTGRPDAGGRDAARPGAGALLAAVAGGLHVGRQPAPRRRRAAGVAGCRAGGRSGGRRSLPGQGAGGGCSGRRVRWGSRAAERRAGADAAAGAAGRSGAAVRSSRRGLGGRGRLRRGRGLGLGGLGGERLRRLAHDRGLDGRAGALDVLAHARSGARGASCCHSELLGERAHTDLRHISPVPGPCSGQARTVVTAGGCSSLSTHRVLISVKPALGSLLPAMDGWLLGSGVPA